MTTTEVNIELTAGQIQEQLDQLCEKYPFIKIESVPSMPLRQVVSLQLDWGRQYLESQESLFREGYGYADHFYTARQVAFQYHIEVADYLMLDRIEEANGCFQNLLDCLEEYATNHIDIQKMLDNYCHR